MTVDWLQWWQKQPPGHHDTHEVVAYINEHLLEGQEALLTAETQYAVLRVIRAVQRWSQEINFRLGVGFAPAAALASDLQAVELVRPSAEVTVPMPQARIGPVSAAAAVQAVRPSAQAVSQHPLAALGIHAACASIQFITAAMDARSP